MAKKPDKKTDKNNKGNKDLQLIDDLAARLERHDLTAISYRHKETYIHLSRGGAMVAAPLTAPAASAKLSEQEKEKEPEESGHKVTAPLVGTIYVAPEPGAPPFVSEGSAVSSGQTLLIVEAMKTMNPVTAPIGGIVKKILVQDGEPVEYGQTLLLITPS